MPHREVFIDGKKVSSVTEVVGLLDKSVFLVPWANSVGTKKLKAALKELKLDCAAFLASLPPLFFEENGFERETFLLDAEGIKEIARERGSSYHEKIEGYLKRVLLGDLAVENHPLIEVFDCWFRDIQPQIISIEETYLDKTIPLQGTPDVCMRVGRVPVIFDWKFTGRLSIHNLLQLVGYAKLTGYKTGKLVRFYENKRPGKETKIRTSKNGSLLYSFEGNKWNLEERTFQNLDEYWPVFESLLNLKTFTDGFKI